MSEFYGQDSGVVTNKTGVVITAQMQEWCQIMQERFLHNSYASDAKKYGSGYYSAGTRVVSDRAGVVIPA